MSIVVAQKFTIQNAFSILSDGSSPILVKNK